MPQFTSSRAMGALLVLSVVVSASFAGGVAGAAGPTVQVGDADIAVGGTENVTLVLSNAPDGVSGFDLNVSVADGSTARISELAVGSFSLPRKTISDGGREGFAKGADLDREHEPGASDVRLVEVTLEGVSNGRTTLQIDRTNIDDDDGNNVDPTLESASVVVGDPGAETDSTTTPSETESGGDSGGQGGEATAEWSTTNVSDGATISVRELPSTATLNADISGTAQGSGLSVQTLDIEPRFSIEDSFRVEVGTPTDAPEETAAFDNGAAVGYFTMDAIGVESDQLESATVEVDVDTDELPEGESLESATLYRYHDGEWQPLQTSVAEGSTLEASTPGFSAFAVAVPDDGAATATPTPTDDGTPSDDTATPTADGTSTDGTESSTETDDGGGLGFILGGVGLVAIGLIVGGGLYLSARV